MIRRTGDLTLHGLALEARLAHTEISNTSWLIHHCQLMQVQHKAYKLDIHTVFLPESFYHLKKEGRPITPDPFNFTTLAEKKLLAAHCERLFPLITASLLETHPRDFISFNDWIGCLRSHSTRFQLYYVTANTLLKIIKGAEVWCRTELTKYVP